MSGGKKLHRKGKLEGESVGRREWERWGEGGGREKGGWGIGGKHVFNLVPRGLPTMRGQVCMCVGWGVYDNRTPLSITAVPR